ncbi:hypothetical protein BD410DRAFT_782658 [Rickenella mellea]|uniref:Hydrophobin n=1 Tax=Rickenella mellea TaxID=50990 RepID=A0A4Y7QKF2_9AGAM|nr:hypothetical protein BD410DRAFT_782658 [Rickenella mellea]
MFAKTLPCLTLVAAFVSAATTLTPSPSPSIIIDPLPPLCPLRNVTCCQNVGDVSQPAVDLALLKAGLKPKKEFNLVGYGNCRNQTTSPIACFNELLCCQDNDHKGLVALTCRVLRPTPEPTVTPL